MLHLPIVTRIVFKMKNYELKFWQWKIFLWGVFPGWYFSVEIEGRRLFRKETLHV